MVKKKTTKKKSIGKGGKNNPGRSHAHTEKEVANALRKANGLVSVAARALKVCSKTIYDRVKVCPELKQIIHESRRSLIDVAEKSLRLRVQAGEGWACALVLKTLGKNRGYKEITYQRHGGDKKAGPIKLEHTSSISADELAKELSPASCKELLTLLEKKEQEKKEQEKKLKEGGG